MDTNPFTNITDDSLPILQAPLNKAKKDRFRLILTIPNILKRLNNRNKREDAFLNLDTLQYSVYNINIPPTIIQSIPLRFDRQNYNVTSYNRTTYDPITVNFAVDNEFKNYWVLWKWMQLINDPQTSQYADTNIYPEGKPVIEPEIYTEYQTNIDVFGLDEYENERIHFQFKYAFIQKLGELNYNYRESTESDCNFEFVFNQLEVHLI